MAAGSKDDLTGLHGLLTKVFKNRLDQDINGEYPIDAASLGVIRQFLKDNSVTADPADNSEIKELQDRLKDASRRRREARENIINLAERAADDAATEHLMNKLG